MHEPPSRKVTMGKRGVALRVMLGAGIWGGFLGTLAGAVLGILGGAVVGDICLGLDGALVGGCLLALVGAVYGAFLGPSDECTLWRAGPRKASAHRTGEEERDRPRQTLAAPGTERWFQADKETLK
jgi:hypothetical protein